jgi:endonuclease V-like protein UPF0215 family
MTEDKNVAERIATQQPDLAVIFKEPSYDDLKAALETYLNPEGDAAAETAAETVTTEKAPEPAPAGVNKVDDVSAAFDELFND